jgi:hypothetical protein
LEFKNIILEENLSNKLKNSHDNFSGVRLSMVLGLLALIYREALRQRIFYDRF